MKLKDQKLLDDVFLQPWFLPQDAAIAVKNVIPREQRYKMRFYFDDYGCMKCEKKDVRYGSNGMCKLCAQQVKLKLFFAIKRRWTAKCPANIPRTFTRIGDAQRILADLVGKVRATPTNRH